MLYPLPQSTTILPKFLVLFLRGILKCFIKFLITTHREIRTTKTHEHKMWAWSCDFQHGFFRVTTSLALCWKKELLLSNSLTSAHSLHPSTHSLLRYHHKLCNTPSQSQFNTSDSFLQQWHEGYGTTIF